MKLPSILAAAGLALLCCMSQSQAAVVSVTVSGVSTFSTPPGQSYPTATLGNGHFTANYSYDDSVISTVGDSTLFSGALLSFSMTFTGGTTFTASGGDLRSDSNQLSIVAVTGNNFPTLSGWNYNNLFLFKLVPTSGTTVPTGRLPTATELSSGYAQWYSWIGYGTGYNNFVLTQTAFSAVPEPASPLLVIAGLALFLSRRRRS